MKTMKKLVALFASVVLALGMMVTSFAAETTGYSITVPEKEGHTYQIYQIFTGDLSDGILSNVVWGKNGTGTEGEKVDSDILKELEEISKTASDSEKLDVITKYVDLESEVYEEGNATNAPAGYYLVKDKGPVTGEDDFYTTYIVKVVEDVTLAPKGSVPEPTKKIVEGENRVDKNEANIGDTVNYEITGTLPSNINDYKEYYYKFKDTLSKGLTFNEDVKVTIGGVDVTKYFYVGTEDGENDATIINVTIGDVKCLNNLEGVTIDADTVIVVTYSATVNEEAVIAGEGNPNDVKLIFSNDPNHSGNGKPIENPPEEPGDKEPTTTHPTGETPKKDVVTYVTELTITKVDENGKVLTGAEFTLTGDFNKVKVTTTTEFVEAENGNYYKLVNGTYTTTAPILEDEKDDDGNVTVKNNKADYDLEAGMFEKKTSTTTMGNTDPKTAVKAEVAADGTVTFTGLGAGHYTITESKTPAGYNTIKDIEFDVTFTDGTFAVENETNNAVISVNNNTLSTTIVNEAGVELPSTGGIGTTLFYIIGGLMALFAGVLLITKRRMNAR